MASIPTVIIVLVCVSLGNTTLTNLLGELFTSKRKKHFRLKGEHAKDHLNKMEILLVKCKEDKQIIPAEFELNKTIQEQQVKLN